MPAVSASTRFQLFCGGVFATVALIHLGLLRFGWQGVLPGLALVSAWWALTTLTQPAWNRLHPTPSPEASTPTSVAISRPRIRHVFHRLAPLAFVLAQTLLSVAFAYHVWRQLRALAGSSTTPPLPLTATLPITPDATLTRTVILSVALFFLLYFLRQAIASREIPRRSDPRAGLTLLLILLLAQAAAGLATLYAPSWNLARPLAFATTTLALLLPLEWLLSGLARWFQSPSQRRAHPFSGYSLSTGALLGGSSPLQTIATSVHDAFGLEIRGSWLARYARLCVEPLLLIIVLTGWLSTAVVIVPPDSEAVRVTWGKFQKETLSPGLHFIAPWPMERVRLVPVGRVQDFALGFERDLGGPVLWTEVHFSGESNLLVGNGEEALTFNVPVHFDIAGALASERTSADLPRLLSNLAQRELLIATASRDSFGIMTGERDVVSNQIRDRLQSSADALHLGARIRYVGLKDIHPPVDVAPAFQEVISAFEQRRMMIDLASANRITALAQASSESFNVRRQAESFSAERLAAVTGEAAILTGKVDARAAAPALFDFRNRLSVLEEVIPRIRLVLTAHPPAGPRTPLLYDLRDGANSLP
jgi:regulator of protease activity HflC (stomatin/prohibitin superfamily)